MLAGLEENDFGVEHTNTRKRKRAGNSSKSVQMDRDARCLVCRKTVPNEAEASGFNVKNLKEDRGKRANAGHPKELNVHRHRRSSKKEHSFRRGYDTA